MEMKMKVTMSDSTTKDCTAQFADFVMFERTWNRSVTKFQEELRLTDLAWLAWRSEIRLKNISIQFDEWLEKVADIDVLSDDDEPVVEVAPASDPLV
jgi:hypothetical protein